MAARSSAGRQSFAWAGKRVKPDGIYSGLVGGAILGADSERYEGRGTKFHTFNSDSRFACHWHTEARSPRRSSSIRERAAGILRPFPTVWRRLSRINGGGLRCARKWMESNGPRVCGAERTAAPYSPSRRRCAVKRETAIACVSNYAFRSSFERISGTDRTNCRAALRWCNRHPRSDGPPSSHFAERPVRSTRLVHRASGRLRHSRATMAGLVGHRARRFVGRTGFGVGPS